MGMGGTDKEYSIDSARRQGWSKADIQEAAKGTPLEKTVKKYDFNKPVASKPAKKMTPQSTSSKSGKKAPSMDEWLKAAKKKNPGVDENTLKEYYNSKYVGA